MSVILLLLTDTLALTSSPRNSTYTFSPTTGLIHLHNIDSIHPAPHQAFFSALQAALTKLGLGGTQQTGAPTSQSRALPPSPDRS